MSKKREESIEKILPKIEELKSACYNEGLPVFILICTDDPTDKKDAKYFADMVSPALEGQKPKSIFGKFIQVLNGFKTVPHVNNDFNIDEFAIPEEYRFTKENIEALADNEE